MWKIDNAGYSHWTGSKPCLHSGTINHDVDLTSVAPSGVFRLKLTEGDRPLYAIRAAWDGLDLPHTLYGSYAVVATPFGRALVRLDSRRCGMTFEYLRVADETDVVGKDVTGAAARTGEHQFYW
jgi:hypothetical protein